MDWSRDNVLHFLNLIRERPVIWDSHSQDYRDKQKKNVAFQEIASLLCCSVQTINAKWISLRNQYSREKRNMIGLRVYESKWYAYKEMVRLMDCKAPQRTYINYSELQNNTRKTLNEIETENADIKKEILVTEEEPYTPLSNHVEAQMLVLEERLDPLSSICDSTEYSVCDKDSHSDDQEGDYLDNHKMEECGSSRSTMNMNKDTPKTQKYQCRCQNIALRHKQLLESTAAIKRLFYKKKLEAAVIEKRTNIVNYKVAIRKAKLIDMELKIKQLELNSMKTK